MLSQIKDLTAGVSGGLHLYKAYQDLNAPDIDYDVLRLSADQKNLEADSVLVEVEQEANAIREHFLESVGTYKAMKARRGVKVGAGDIAANLERSAMAEGEDIQTIRENAKFRAQQLRARGKQYKVGAEDQKEIGYWERLGKSTEGVQGAIKSFKKAGWMGNNKKKKVI